MKHRLVILDLDFKRVKELEFDDIEDVIKYMNENSLPEDQIYRLDLNNG